MTDIWTWYRISVNGTEPFYLAAFPMNYEGKLDEKNLSGTFACTFLVGDAVILTSVVFGGETITDPEKLRALDQYAMTLEPK